MQGAYALVRGGSSTSNLVEPSRTTSYEAKSEGLVRYPTTLAPVSGSVTVTTQCADNAHVINSTSLNATCTSNGTWTGLTLHCQCDTGYHKVTVNGTHM